MSGSGSSESFSFLRLNTIFNYLNASATSRSVTEGEEILFAKLLILCGVVKVEGANYFIKGLCLQTSALSSPPHEIDGHLIINGSRVDIGSFKCSCKAGLSGTCKHVSACLFYCNRDSIDNLEKLSSTDVSCYWQGNKKETQKNFAPKPVCEFDCIPAKRKICRTLSAEERSHCLKRLREQSDSSILFKHFSGTCGGVEKRNENIAVEVPSETEADEGRSEKEKTYIKTIIASAATSMFLNELNISQPELKTCCRKLMEVLERADCEESGMIFQRSSEWTELRRLRITGSTCYSIFTYSKSDWEKKTKSCLFSRKFETVATKHGIKFEEEALNKYKDLYSFEIVTPGFIICEKYPWLGYSPDGIAMDENGYPSRLIEIKCPLRGAEEDIEQFIDSCKYLQRRNGEYELKRKHQYFAQIQFGMALSNTQLCDFIIYSPKTQRIFKIEVYFDKDYTRELLKTVSDKFFNKMIHFVCNK